MLYFNVLRTSVEDVDRTLVRDVPWCYIEYHKGMSISRSLRHPQDLLGMYFCRVGLVTRSFSNIIV